MKKSDQYRSSRPTYLCSRAKGDGGGGGYDGDDGDE